MAYNFFGVYFENENGIEYRCGFHDDNHYMPLLERKDPQGWVEVNQNQGTGAAAATCRDIRDELPVIIPFNNGHTQNERMELINQIVYNINRYTTERVNYQGAHA
jgi:hypothetical protein